MAENSKIEWTTHTFNPWVGCTKVSPACDRCYAEAWAKRTGHPELWTGERRRTTPANWNKPLKWNWAADRAQRRDRVFCASLADVFDNQVPDEWRHNLWDLIRFTPALDWLLLTKRPQNIRKMLPADWGNGFHNVWLGMTAENQEEFDRRWPSLRAIPAVVRFISYEPAIGPLDVRNALEFETDNNGPIYRDLHWVICGGESGSGPRMMDPAWARSMRDQCADASAAFFMKQMTGKKPIPDDLLIRQFPEPRP